VPTLDDVAAAAAPTGLGVLGVLHPEPGDDAPDGAGTLVLLGPDGPDFWEVFTASPEYRDGGADPMNRWSERVLGALAGRLGGVALFPFGGPPWQPFTHWAQRSGAAWESPVGLLVHARTGLFVSYRGALAFTDRMALPASGPRPCDTCPQPCRDACPAGVLGPAGYDVPGCHAFLDTAAGCGCFTRGCAVRRACPVGRESRPEAQSAFHMAAFHGRQAPCDA
jgi:hypothetical protein